MVVEQAYMSDKYTCQESELLLGEHTFRLKGCRANVHPRVQSPAAKRRAYERLVAKIFASNRPEANHPKAKRLASEYLASKRKRLKN